MKEISITEKILQEWQRTREALVDKISERFRLSRRDSDFIDEAFDDLYEAIYQGVSAELREELNLVESAVDRRRQGG